MARAKTIGFGPDLTATVPKETLRTRMDEEYYPLLDHIYDVYGIEKFAALQEQERLEMMRDFIDRETLSEDLLYE